MLSPSNHDIEARQRRLATHFKRCPLCGALSIMEATECTTCAWHGGFDHDPSAVEARFIELLSKCPSIVEAMPKRTSTGMSLKVRLRKFWRALGRRAPFDIRA